MSIRKPNIALWQLIAKEDYDAICDLIDNDVTGLGASIYSQHKKYDEDTIFWRSLSAGGVLRRPAPQSQTDYAYDAQNQIFTFLAGWTFVLANAKAADPYKIVTLTQPRQINGVTNGMAIFAMPSPSEVTTSLAQRVFIDPETGQEYLANVPTIREHEVLFRGAAPWHLSLLEEGWTLLGVYLGNIGFIPMPAIIARDNAPVPSIVMAIRELASEIAAVKGESEWHYEVSASCKALRDEIVAIKGVPWGSSPPISLADILDELKACGASLKVTAGEVSQTGPLKWMAQNVIGQIALVGETVITLNRPGGYSVQVQLLPARGIYQLYLDDDLIITEVVTVNDSILVMHAMLEVQDPPAEVTLVFTPSPAPQMITGGYMSITRIGRL